MKILNGMWHVCFKKIRITDTSNKDIVTLFKQLKIIKGQNEKHSNLFFLSLRGAIKQNIRGHVSNSQRRGLKG